MQSQCGHRNEFQYAEIFAIFASRNVYAYGSMKLFTNCVQRKSYQINENRNYRNSINYYIFYFLTYEYESAIRLFQLRPIYVRNDNPSF